MRGSMYSQAMVSQGSEGRSTDTTVAYVFGALNWGWQSCGSSALHAVSITNLCEVADGSVLAERRPNPREPCRCDQTSSEKEGLGSTGLLGALGQCVPKGERVPAQAAPLHKESPD